LIQRKDVFHISLKRY